MMSMRHGVLVAGGVAGALFLGGCAGGPEAGGPQITDGNEPGYELPLYDQSMDPEELTQIFGMDVPECDPRLQHESRRVILGEIAVGDQLDKYSSGDPELALSIDGGVGSVFEAANLPPYGSEFAWGAKSAGGDMVAVEVQGGHLEILRVTNERGEHCLLGSVELVFAEDPDGSLRYQGLGTKGAGDAFYKLDNIGDYGYVVDGEPIDAEQTALVVDELRTAATALTLGVLLTEGTQAESTESDGKVFEV